MKKEKEKKRTQVSEERRIMIMKFENVATRIKNLCSTFKKLLLI
jgi:hypothetical protein